MASATHDTLVYRLAQILVKLNQGEKLDPQVLADEFGVNLRTIQRDLNERFAYLPIEKADGYYRLDPAFLGKLTTRDVERFAGLAGVKGLFPSLSDDFLRDIFDSRVQSAFLVKGHCYEDLGGSASLFRELEMAIISHHQISIDYEKTDGRKFYAALFPYKLINNKGIWYLVALDSEKLKTFSFSKIKRLRTLDMTFEPKSDVEKQLAEEDGVWLSEDRQEVVLKIGRDVAHYFKRRRLVANQVIEKELEDGGLIVSAKVGHPNQIVPIVRYWIPHIRIISPKKLQASLEEEIECYVRS